MNKIRNLVHNLYPHKISPRLSRSVEVTCIPEFSLVQILLEAIKYILYSSVYLHFDMIFQHKSIIQFQVEIHELRSVLHT